MSNNDSGGFGWIILVGFFFWYMAADDAKHEKAQAAAQTAAVYATQQPAESYSYSGGYYGTDDIAGRTDNGKGYYTSSGDYYDAEEYRDELRSQAAEAALDEMLAAGMDPNEAEDLAEDFAADAVADFESQF